MYAKVYFSLRSLEAGSDAISMPVVELRSTQVPRVLIYDSKIRCTLCQRSTNERPTFFSDSVRFSGTAVD